MSAAEKPALVRREKNAQAANDLFAAAQKKARQTPAKRRAGPITAAEVNEYLRSLPRVTVEDMERGTA